MKHCFTVAWVIEVIGTICFLRTYGWGPTVMFVMVFEIFARGLGKGKEAK